MRTFKAAVLATPSAADAYCEGIQALEKEHRKMLKSSNLATGSIDLDAALLASQPSANRWDYGIGLPCDTHTEKVLWLEPHHTGGGENDRVIRKLTWLKNWLASDAPELAKMPRVFVWIITGDTGNPNDRKKRTQLAQSHGLMVKAGNMDLKDFTG